MIRPKALGGLCLLAGLSFALGARVAGRRAPSVNAEISVVATVNDEKLTPADLQIALSAYRRSAIEDMVAQKLLLQQAKRAGIPVPPEVDPTPQPGIFPDEAVAMARQARSESMRRKLSLAGFSQAQKQQAFADLGPELRRYTLQVIILKHAEEYPILQREIEGGASFESLLPKYTMNPSADGLLQEVPRSTVSQLLGPYVADSLLLLKEGQISPPNPSPLGPAVVKLVKLKDTYTELEVFLDDVLVQSEALALDHRLGTGAYVTSAYVPELAERSKLKLTGDKPLDLKSLKPIAATPPHPLPRAKVIPLRRLAGPLLKSPTAPKAASLKPLQPIPLRPQPQPTALGILKATIEKSSHRLLQAQLDKKTVLRLDINDNHHADAFEPVLVTIGPQGWKAVDQLDHSLNRFSMENDYGYWSDRAIYAWQGILNGKLMVTRALNGRIEPDEVRLKKLQKVDEGGHVFLIGAEIQRDDQGRLFHLEQTAYYSRNTEVDKQDLRRLQDYRDSDANWAVAQE